MSFTHFLINVIFFQTMWKNTHSGFFGDLCVYFLFEICALSKFAIDTFSAGHLKSRKKDKRKRNIIEQSFYLNKTPMILIEGKLTS